MTLDQFRKTQKETNDGFIYASYWHVSNVEIDGDEYYIVAGVSFDTLEEAEEVLYGMYCEEGRLTEGY